MANLFVYMSRYIFVILIIMFVVLSVAMNYNIQIKQKKRARVYYIAQKFLILLTHFTGFVILIISNDHTIDYVVLYVEEFLLFVFVWFIIDTFYKKTNLLIWNIAMFFMSISYIMLTRLDFGTGVRQFKLSLLAFAIALIIPIIFKKINFLNRLQWLYISICFVLLLLANTTMNGSRNWIAFGDFSFQPSELVKVIYVFFLSAYFSKSITKIKLIFTAILSGLLIIILVWQRDLGGALIFYVLFVSIFYLMTNKIYYVFMALLAGGAASTVAYYLFSHVRVRVEAFMNPWAKIDSEGYQITQSLFAISNGKLFGTGLFNGHPKDIPVVITDFIYSAISEEFGNVFSLFLISIFMVFLISSINIAMNTKNQFRFILASGIAIIISFQTILIIGGVTKLIPITGVTLPFVSYGGSSLLSAYIMIGVLQGVVYKDTYKTNKNKDNNKTKKDKQ